MYKLVFAQREVIHYSKSPNANFLDLVFIKWCVEVINDIKNKFCSISTKQDNFSRFDSFLSKLPISCTILATLSQSRGPGGFKFTVFDAFIRKYRFLRHNLFQKWKCLHLKTKYAFLTFSGSNTDHYPRATVAMETVDQGIKLKLVELFFLKYEHKWPWF